MSRSKREPKFQDLFRLEAKSHEIEDDLQRIMEGVYSSKRWRPSRYEGKGQFGQGGSDKRRPSSTGRGRRKEANAVTSNTINTQTGISVNVGMAENMGLLIPGQKRQGFEVAPSDMYPRKVSRVARHEGGNAEIVFPSSTELRVDRTLILPEAPQPGQVQILATSKQTPQAFEKDGHTRDSHWLFQI